MDTSITDLKILPLPESKYLKPFRMEFRQNGVLRNWDCVKAMNSVSLFLYHDERDAFLLVKQFRPAVWYSQQNEGIKTAEQGYTYELCAGLMDKNLSPEQTIREEAIEEVGYDIERIERVTMTYGAFGFGGNMQTMFYATINENMRVNSGGGIDGEQIELVFVPRAEFEKFMYDESKVKGFGLLFAYLWWKDKFKDG